MRRIVSLGAALVCSACVSNSPSFVGKTYTHPDYPYVMQLEGPDAAHGLGESWRLDNYVFENELPTRQKSSSEYEVTRQYDTDDDGEFNVEEQEAFYDLLFEHRQKDAHAWVRTVPISSHDAGKDLSVFAERYVRAASGAGSVVVRFGTEGQVGVVEKRVASRILSTVECQVSGQPAHVVDFEIANVDELQLSKDARWVRGRLLFVRTAYKRVIMNLSDKEFQYPVIMLIGLSSVPADFANIAGDFDKLVNGLVLRSDAKEPIKRTPSSCTIAATSVVSQEPPSSGGELPANAGAEPASEAQPPAVPPVAGPETLVDAPSAAPSP